MKIIPADNPVDLLKEVDIMLACASPYIVRLHDCYYKVRHSDLTLAFHAVSMECTTVAVRFLIICKLDGVVVDCSPRAHTGDVKQTGRFGEKLRRKLRRPPEWDNLLLGLMNYHQNEKLSRLSRIPEMSCRGLAHCRHRRPSFARPWNVVNFFPAARHQS